MRRLLVLAVLFALGVAAPAASASPVTTGTWSGGGYYLALGDSLAAGYQPGAGDDKAGGYAGLVNAALSGFGRSTLVNLACSGETTTTMINGGECAYPQGSQLAAAVAFLKGHAHWTHVITVDIGANDVQRCVRVGIDNACLAAGLQAVAANLPVILGQLRAAAPRAQIIVLNYYNPFLAAYLLGPTGQGVAYATALLQPVLNASIAQSAAGVAARVADVAGLFQSTNWTTVTLPGAGQMPANVALICVWTWMCTQGDFHANDAGYAVLAKAVASEVEPPH